VGGVERGEAERAAWGVNSEVRTRFAYAMAFSNLEAGVFWLGGVRVKRS